MYEIICYSKIVYIFFFYIDILLFFVLVTVISCMDGFKL